MSEDGRRLKVVHLQDNEFMYQGKFNFTLYQALVAIQMDLTFLDNEVYNMDFRREEVQ